MGYSFGFILISWGCLTSPTFFFFCFLQWANLIGPLQKKVETMEAPQNRRRLYGKMQCFFQPSYLVGCSQIWLNLLMDDCHFSSYITKLTQPPSLKTKTKKNPKLQLSNSLSNVSWIMSRWEVAKNTLLLSFNVLDFVWGGEVRDNSQLSSTFIIHLKEVLTDNTVA